jgi:hypothetical protein
VQIIWSYFFYFNFRISITESDILKTRPFQLII